MMGWAGLRVLMYHKLSASVCDRFTVSRDLFEQHLRYLRYREYRSVRLNDLLASDSRGIDSQCVALTFDDGYQSIADFAAPLLERYGFSATCFVPVGLIGSDNQWDGGGTPLMNESVLRALPQQVLEIGLHSWAHEDYRNFSCDEIRRDVTACRTRLEELRIPYVPVLAYPYGRVPPTSRLRKQWGEALHYAGIRVACRVGNRLNRMPARDPMMITRTAIYGTDSKWKFCVKVSLGRCTL